MEMMNPSPSGGDKMQAGRTSLLNTRMSVNIEPELWAEKYISPDSPRLRIVVF